MNTKQALVASLEQTPTLSIASMAKAAARETLARKAKEHLDAADQLMIAQDWRAAADNLAYAAGALRAYADNVEPS